MLMSLFVKLVNSVKVILLVNHCLELKMSSKVLSVASKRLSAMFSNTHSEGQLIGGITGPKIEYPEDRAPAMSRMRALLHHKSLRLGTEDLADALHGITLLTDKYICLAALKSSLYALRNQSVT